MRVGDIMRHIVEGVYEVAGPDSTGGGDASAYLVVSEGAAALIDAGCDATGGLLENLNKVLKKSSAQLETMILTHNHIDHVGGAAAIRERYAPRVVMHAADAAAVESADPIVTAADWYGLPLKAVPVDVRLNAKEEIIPLGDETLRCIHTPGHTPGSISVLLERDGRKILFGQDIHGPFLPQFRSDIKQWRASMEMLLNLDCDILCEGHFGIVEPAINVGAFIRRHLKAQGS